jgi:2-polyprenyl-3-methyl-5-hydroxy-6-metoxy-1,4-benzoquinol methylase
MQTASERPGRVVDRLAREGGWVRDALRKYLFAPRVPAHLSKNFRPLDEAGTERLRKSLLKNFFARRPDAYLATQAGMRDLANHMTGRLEQDRRTIVPWLDSVRRLVGSRILEVGCGTGASTIALAEQGARVVGIDVDAVALRDAEERCRIYGLAASLAHANGADLSRLFSPGQFDVIIFYASLEHMTHAERISALSTSWALLPAGGALAVVDTPNRLWFYDSHTALAPFFHWLPDDLAMKYSRLCPREGFNTRFSEFSATSYLDFMRWGRGASFHEFEVAIDGVDLTSLVSCASLFARQQRMLARLKWRLSPEGRYAKFISRLKPDVHSGFFQPYLNLALMKPMPAQRSTRLTAGQ